jgi:D-glycero-D-manno-heptose 1,7-bisphosphate phosphatase
MGKCPVKRSAVFLDRDGVLNHAIIRGGLPFPPLDVAEFQLHKDIQKGCRRLKDSGFLLIVVTNQPDVGRGTISRAAVERVNQELQSLVPEIDRIETCFHAGERHGQLCDCRKPKPGMLLRAAQELGIGLKSSYMIGDRWRDIDCAHAANCRSIFIDRGYSEAPRQRPYFTVTSFGEAVDILLRDAGAQLHSVSPPRPR